MNSDNSVCGNAGNTKVGHWLFLMSINMKCKGDNMVGCDSLRNRSNSDAQTDCIRAFSNLSLSVFSAKSAEVWRRPARTTLAKLLLWRLFNRSYSWRSSRSLTIPARYHCHSQICLGNSSKEPSGTSLSVARHLRNDAD